MNIGNKIKELRKQRGVTQEQLADSIGVSFQAVSKWENNIALPDITLVPTKTIQPTFKNTKSRNMPFGNAFLPGCSTSDMGRRHSGLATRL